MKYTESEDRPLRPDEYVFAMIWAKDITFEPNDPKNKGREQE